jgi:hypothetical protein
MSHNVKKVKIIKIRDQRYVDAEEEPPVKEEENKNEAFKSSRSLSNQKKNKKRG